MNALDWVLIIPLAFFAFRGFQHGLIKEIAGIVGLFLAVFLSFNYMYIAGDIIGSLLNISQDALPYVGAISVFVLALVGVQLAVSAIDKILEAAALSLVNKIAGAAFGGLKVGILLSALLLFAAGFNQPNEELRQNSISYPIVIQIAPLAYNTIALVYPGAENFADTIQEAIDAQKSSFLDQYFN